jgi:hypothetical protein
LTTRKKRIRNGHPSLTGRWSALRKREIGPLITGSSQGTTIKGGDPESLLYKLLTAFSGN